MPMPMWLTRPREFEQLDQAINDACCSGNLGALQSWVARLDAVVSGQEHDGIGASTGVFPSSGPPGGGQSHFYRHWVGDDASGTPPEYWPYAWGPRTDWGPPNPGDPDDRLRIDRLISFGLAWSIRKVIAAREMVDNDNPDEWNRPRCSPCRTHSTVWVCFEVSETDRHLAEASLPSRRSLFRVGVIESRDAVVLVVKTPRPIELSGGTSDPTKVTAGGPEQLYMEPVIGTQAFTAHDQPRWTQPMTPAPTVLGSATKFDVEQQPLPPGGHMPKGTYPGAPDVNTYTFVEMPSSEDIKNILRAAPRGPGGLDLSDELINRLRISIADE